MTLPVHVEVDESKILKLTKVYKEAYKSIVDEIAGATNFGVANRKQLLAQIEAILIQLGADVDDFLKKELPEYYKVGADDAVSQLKDIGADIPVKRGFNHIHQEAISALIDDTARAFGETISGVNRSANLLLGKAVREMITQKLAEGSIGGKASREIRNTITGILKDQGLAALVDKSGKRWSLDTYAEMLLRTKAVEARNRGLLNRMAENGYDLVQVSQHFGSCDMCAPWEGKVLSATGATKGYPTVRDAEEAGLFHPNCKHAINRLIPELSELTKAYDPNNPTKTIDQAELDDITRRNTELTVYRGTGKPTPASKMNAYGKGTYYSLDPEYAEIFGDVKESTIKFKNPLVLDSQDDVDRATRAMIEDGLEDLGAWAKKNGYDGIIDRKTQIVLAMD